MSLSVDSAVADSSRHRSASVSDDAAVPPLFAEGEVGPLMRGVDWAATPRGPIEQWPQSLRTVVRILLTSRFAMWMGWGPGLTFLYNDAYAHMTLGKKHPKGLTYDIRLGESPLAVSVDREKLTQILLNLLTNAVKFTPPGGRVTVDAVTRTGAENDVFVRVMDTGIGIRARRRTRSSSRSSR